MVKTNIEIDISGEFTNIDLMVCICSRLKYEGYHKLRKEFLSRARVTMKQSELLEITKEYVKVNTKNCYDCVFGKFCLEFNLNDSDTKAKDCTDYLEE